MIYLTENINAVDEMELLVGVEHIMVQTGARVPEELKWLLSYLTAAIFFKEYIFI